MIRSYRFRLQMKRSLQSSFEKAMVISNELYNAALEERIQAWKKARISISKFDQIKSLTIIRRDDCEFAKYARTMLRNPITQVDEAFKAFFSRVKLGKEKAGFPRFRSLKNLKSFGFTEASGWTLKGRFLSMKGLPNVRLKMHRQLEGKALKLTVKKDGRGRWFAIIVVKLQDVFGPVAPGAVGLDLGITDQVTTSDGIRYGKINPEHRNAVKRLKVEQQMARCQRGSKRRKKIVARLRRIRQKEADARRTKHFQLASKIITSAPGIIVTEKLTVKNMTRSAKGTLAKPGVNVAAKSGLNRSLQDSALSQFVKILTDKAESAGRLVIAVDPKNTSQNCSGCGIKVKKSLSQRQHNCPDCGISLHRDHNAALNVLHRGVVVPEMVRLVA
jgi:putative transposase